MKQGFSVLIQQDLSPTQTQEAKKFANMFISQTCADPKMRYFGEKGGGYTTGMWRGRLGKFV